MKKTKKVARLMAGLLLAFVVTMAIPQLSLRAETGDDEGSEAPKCKATATCPKKTFDDPGESEVSCSGKKCTSGDGWVECDGTKTTCPK